MAGKHQYRYRTGALVGPWRSSRRAAIRDALAAGQAAHQPGVVDGLKWLVDGQIEERAPARGGLWP